MVLETVVVTTPVVKFTWFPEVEMLSENCPPSAFPTWVRSGLLTVWNWVVEMKVGRMWNWTSWIFCWSERELSVPDARLLKALSVGAKIVRPWLELPSSVSIWLASWVLLSSLIKVVNWPAFSRIWVMFVWLEGEDDGAWAEVTAG